MFLAFLNFFRVKWLRTGPFFIACTRVILALAKLKQVNIKTNFEYFQVSNSVRNGILKLNNHKNVRLDIAFVATEKDFSILKHSITNVLRVTKGFQSASVSIVIPDRSMEKAIQLLGDNFGVNLIPESQIVGYDILNDLKASFGSRANWIYQQLLKVEFISRSVNHYCLIVDADTILLKPRLWLDQDWKIGLTPTDEENPDYHQFLMVMEVISHSPTTSFVPHHMFYGVESFRLLMSTIGFHDPKSVVALIDKNMNKLSASPVSIDYELYGQWMLTQNPNNVNLIKWSNIGVPRSKAAMILKHRIFLSFIGIFYNSISFHDYS